MSRAKITWSTWVLVLAAGACQPGEERAVARVGERVITVADYQEMAAALLAGPLRQLPLSDPESGLKLLDAMVAKELVLLEARTRGLDRQPSVALPVHRLDTGLLVRALLNRAQTGIEPTDLEVELYFYEEGFDRETRVSAISCASTEEAQQVLAALQSGADFAALASSRPVQPPGSQSGGDLGYMAPTELLPEVRDPILGLAPNQIYSQPLQTRYGLQVVKVTDRRTVTLADRRDRVRDRLRLERQAARLAAYTDSLRRVCGLRCVPPGALDAGSPDQVLCRWEGGRLTMADYREYLELQEETVPADSVALGLSIDQAAARQVLLAEARRQGCDDAALRRTVQRKEEELLGAALFAVVSAGASVSDEQVRAFYDAHPEIYGPQPAVEVDEILVADTALADQLRRRVQAGEPMADLASRYSTRQATRTKQGRMWLWRRENAFLGALPTAALDAPLGVLQGPLAVPGGYSLFRVRQRDQVTARPLAEARRSIAASLLAQAKTAQMDSLLAVLKVRYRDRVQTYPQVLAAVQLDSLAPQAAGVAAPAP